MICPSLLVLLLFLQHLRRMLEQFPFRIQALSRLLGPPCGGLPPSAVPLKQVLEEVSHLSLLPLLRLLYWLAIGRPTRRLALIDILLEELVVLFDRYFLPLLLLLYGLDDELSV